MLEYIFIEFQLYPSMLSSNRPLHMPDLILKLYVFKFIFIRVISFTTGKMVPRLARGMERTVNVSITFPDNL